MSGSVVILLLALPGFAVVGQAGWPAAG